MTNDLVKRLHTQGALGYFYNAPAIQIEAADRIEQLEKGFLNILTLDDPMLMKMIARACLTGAIDEQGKYCFVPPFALEGASDD